MILLSKTTDIKTKNLYFYVNNKLRMCVGVAPILNHQKDNDLRLSFSWFIANVKFGDEYVDNAYASDFQYHPRFRFRLPFREHVEDNIKKQTF